jgi:hypothetical protein
VLAILAALFDTFAWWSSVGVFSTSKFDPIKWSAPVPDELDSTCYRGGMAIDIRDRLLKPGASKQFIDNLLGKPDHSEPHEYRYVVGMCSGLGWDYDILHIYFGKQEQLTHAVIIHH